MPRISVAALRSNWHQIRTLASIERKHTLHWSRGRHAPPGPSDRPKSPPRTWAAKENPQARNAGPHLAHARCNQHRATGGDVVLHEGLQRLTDKMNCLRRLKSEAATEFFVRHEVPGLGLIYEGLAETFFQHTTPIKLLAQELSSLTTSPVVVTTSRNTRSR